MGSSFNRFLRDRDMKKSSSEPNKVLTKDGFKSFKFEGKWTKFYDGSKTHNMSSKRLEEKTRHW